MLMCKASGSSSASLTYWLDTCLGFRDRTGTAEGSLKTKHHERPGRRKQRVSAGTHDKAVIKTIGRFRYITSRAER
jgi:hypothetical protein